LGRSEQKQKRDYQNIGYADIKNNGRDTFEQVVGNVRVYNIANPVENGIEKGDEEREEHERIRNPWPLSVMGLTPPDLPLKGEEELIKFPSNGGEFFWF